MTGTTAALHQGLAEAGKCHAVEGNHDLALAHYREAMRQAVEAGAPEVHFRHYLECSIESLELLGAHEDVIEYCHRVMAHYEARVPSDELQARFIEHDRAETLQRLGVNLLKAGRVEEALDALSHAIDQTASIDRRLPLAATLHSWLVRRLSIDRDRVMTEQRRHGYFAVTPERVNPGRAVPLPDELLRQVGSHHG